MYFAFDLADRLVDFGFAVAVIALLKVTSGKGFSIDGAAVFSIALMIGSSSTSKLLILSLSLLRAGAFLRLLLPHW